MAIAIGIVGRSNSGKTTLIERLIPELKARGYRVGTLKHDAHGFELDQPGKDTWRHREAGAETVVISGPHQIALIRQTPQPLEPRALIRDYFAHLDLVLVEGFKRFDFPKLEVVRAANSAQPVLPMEDLAGLVTDLPLELPGRPTFGLEAIAAIADHLEHLFRQEAGRAG